MTILFAGTTRAEFVVASGSATTTNVNSNAGEGVSLGDISAYIDEIGIVFYVRNENSGSGNSASFVHFYNEADVRLAHLFGGKDANIQIRNDANTALATGTANLAFSTLYRIVAHIKFNSAGFCKVWRDNDLVLNLSGAIPAANIKRVRFGAGMPGPYSGIVIVDHVPTGILFVSDTSRIVDENTFPTAGGTGGTGVLDDVGGMNDLNFLAAAAAGQKLGYGSAMLSKPPGHEVLGVKVNARVTSLDGASARIYGKVGASDYNQAVQAVPNSYDNIDHYFEVDHSTGSQFADLDAAEAMKVGIKSA